MTTDLFDVFLSYARADDAGADSAAYDDPARSFMRRLYAALTDAGFRVWWDKVHLPARGEEFTAEIERAIRACDRFILVCGPGAAASAYVRAEYLCALRLCKPITPLLLRGDYGVIPAEMGIDAIHAIDCRPPRGEAAAFADAAARLRQDAPLGGLFGVRRVPDEYIERRDAYASALEALRADAIRTTVISAPAKVVSAPQSAVAVFGMGGVGKSVLAAALAHDCGVRRHFHDGVIWLTVGQTPSVPSLQAVVGAHFGDDPTAYDEQGGAVRLSRMLQEKQALIVLDDVWDHRLVERFPVHDTACRLLITTRSSALAGKVQGADVRLGVLTPREGAALIAARTGRGDPADATYQTISARLGGHTLAVALAAAQIASGFADDAADMLRLIEKRFAGDDPFADLKLDETDKDQNLAVSLGLSYAALPSDDLRRRLRALGVFAREGTFDRAALAAVWGDADPDAARAPVAALRGAGLLEDAADGRFALHNLIHAYARALLLRAGEMGEVFARYASWAIAEAGAFHGLPLERWGELDPLVPHLLAVGDALAQADDETACATLPALLIPMRDYFFFRRHQLQHRVRWYERAIVCLRQQDDPRRLSLLLYSVSPLYDGAGEIDRALEVLQEAQNINTASDDPRAIAVTQSKIADLYVQLGRWDEALALYEASLKTIQSLNDPRAIAVTQSAIADLYVQLGRWDEALALYEASLKTIQSLNDPREIAVTQSKIADLYVKLGRWDEALALYEASLKTKKSLNDPREIAVTQSKIADLYVQLGRWDEALALYEASLKTKKSLNDPRAIAVTQSKIADLYVQLGRWDEALALYEASLKTIQSLNDPRAIAVTQSKIADLYVQLGRWDEALALYEASLKTKKSLNDPREIAVTQSSIADLYVQLGRWDEALALYEASLKTIQSLNDPRAIAVTQSKIADLYVQLGRWDEALALYEASLKTIQSLNDPREIAVTQSSIADLYVQLGRWDEALALYEASLKTIQSLNDPRAIAVTQSAIADLYVKLGRWDEALALYEASLKTIQSLNDPREIAVTQSKIADLYVKLGRWDEALALYEASLKTIQSLNDPREIAVTQSKIADLYVQLGRWDEALALYEASLKTIQSLNDPRAIAVTQSSIADLYVQLGRWDEALALYEASLKTIQSLNDPREIAVTQSKIADLYVQLGRWDEALALYEASLKTIQSLNDPRAIAVTQSKIADLYVQLGRWDEALALYEASLKTIQSLNDPRAIAVTQSKIADLYVQLGRWDEALALYEASLKTKKSLNDPREIAVTQSSIADLYVKLGRWDEALALYEASLKTIQSLNDPRAIAVTQTSMGQLLIMRGERVSEAIALLWQAYHTLEGLSNPREIAQMREIITAARGHIGVQQFAALWSQAIGTPLPVWLDTSPDPQADVIAALLGLYQQGGEAAVRAALADANVPEEVMAALLADLAQRAAGAPPGGGVSTLPAETVQTLAGNTTAVRTGVPDKLDEWRAVLTDVRADWAGRGADWAIEVALADALLAICDGARPTLPPDNPYADVVRQVLAAIDGWRG